MSKAPIRVVTALVMFGAGWGLTSLFARVDPPSSDTSSIADPLTRPAPSPSLDPEEILDSLREAPSPETIKPETYAKRMAEMKKQRAELLKRKETFVIDPPFDAVFDAALQAALDDPEALTEFKLTLHAWLKQDPAGCLAHLEANGEQHQGALLEAVDQALIDYTATLDDDGLIDLLSNPLSRRLHHLRSSILSTLAAHAWSEGGVDAIFSRAGEFDQNSRLSFLSRAAITCQPEHREELFARLLTEDAPHLINMLMNTLGGQSTRKEWLDQQASDHPELREQILSSSIYLANKYPPSSEIPLDELLDQLVATNLSSLPDSEKRQQELEALTKVQLNHAKSSFYNQQQELFQRFDAGDIGAEELVSAFNSAFPELGERDPDAVQKELFNMTVRSNPAAASALIEHLAPAEKGALVIQNSATIRAYGSQPRQLLDLFEAVPYDPSQGPLQKRFIEWGAITKRAYADYGDSYPEWILGLDSGVDRDMALSSLALEVKTRNPELSKRLLDAKNFVPPR